MDHSDYLAYSAKEPMTLLRRKFNRGENLYKPSPQTLPAEDALDDVLYAKFVFENAYSGFSYFEKPLFDAAFASIAQAVRRAAQITPEQLIDLFGEKLSFLSDGHLAFTTAEYGRGFFQKLQTWVSDLPVRRIADAYYDVKTGRPVSFEAPVRAFPSLDADGAECCLLGVRSKSPVDAILVTLDGRPERLPLHKIRSREPSEESLLEERYEKDAAVITCSTFVGDSEEDLQRLSEAGRKCRGYRHVIWDLSNNLGGNSDFPKRFLQGLYGGVVCNAAVLELQSTLVHAKETGEIRDIPYRLAALPDTPAEDCSLFDGELHVIINDRVASSGESAVCWAAACPKVTFYGCNSLGIGRFGDLCIYDLPHSGVVLWCPQKVFDTGIPETAGFEPDYWIDSEDVAAVVLNRISRQ